MACFPGGFKEVIKPAPELRLLNQRYVFKKLFIATNLLQSFLEKGDREHAVLDTDPHEFCRVPSYKSILDAIL